MKTEVEPFTLRLPKKLKRKVEKRAKQQKRTLNSQIIHVLESFEGAVESLEGAAVYGSIPGVVAVDGSAIAGNAFKSN